MPGPEEIVTKLVSKATSGGGNFVTDILTSPFKFLKGAISAPFAAVGDMGKGIWNRTIGNPLSVLATSGIIGLVATFIPSAIRWFPMNINGKPVGETMAEHARDGGFPAILKDSLIAGVAVNAAIGGISGAVGGAVEDAKGEKGTAEKAGGTLGAIAAVGGLGYLLYKAVNRNKIEYNGHEEVIPKTPLPTPTVTPPAAKENVITRQ